MPNVNVTYEEMRSAANRLNAGQAEIESKLAELQKLVKSLVNGGYVTDASSKSFDIAYDKFTSSATGTISALATMGEYLTKAANAFETADQQLSNTLNRS